MSGAPGGGHGLPHGDDHGHLPEEEILNLVGDRSYHLEPHEKESLKNIEKRLNSGEHIDHDTLHHYEHFLEHMLEHFKHILQSEHGEHIHNISLEADLKKIMELVNKVKAMMQAHGGHH